MLALDIKSVIAVSMVLTMLYGIGMLLFAWRMQGYRGLYLLAGSDFCMAGAMLLLFLRGYVPDILTIIVANTLILLSLFLNCLAANGLSGRRYSKRMWLVWLTLFAVHLLLFTYFTFIVPSVNLRISIVSLEVAVCFALFAVAIARQDLVLYEKSGMIFILLPVLLLLFFVYRGLYGYFEVPLKSLFMAGSIHSIAIMMLFIFVASKNYFFVYVTAAVMVDTLERIAKIDPLTQLLNRRGLEDAVKREMAKVKRYGGELSFILCDLDHFKRVNDDFGHEAGDEVLKGFGAMLLAHTRAADTCARLGGEEFLVLLPNTGRGGARALASQLRKKCEELSFPEMREHRVTASFGISWYEVGAEYPHLLQQADQALYEAKRTGRNRVICVDELLAEHPAAA